MPTIILIDLHVHVLDPGSSSASDPCVRKELDLNLSLDSPTIQISTPNGVRADHKVSHVLFMHHVDTHNQLHTSVYGSGIIVRNYCLVDDRCTGQKN